MQSAAAPATQRRRQRERAAQNSQSPALMLTPTTCVPDAAALKRRCPLLAVQQRRRRRLPPLQQRTVRLSSGARPGADVCAACMRPEMHQRGGAATRAADGSGPCNPATIVQPAPVAAGADVRPPHARDASHIGVSHTAGPAGQQEHGKADFRCSAQQSKIATLLPRLF